MVNVDLPKKNDLQPMCLDAHEFQKLFESIRGTKLGLSVLVAAFYGLCRGGVCGLKWDTIDPERGTLTVKRAATEVGENEKPKIIMQDSANTKSSLRTLPLVGQFREVFQRSQNIARAEQEGPRQLLQLRL